jgi:two-component system, NarL family, response regulator DesR
MRVIRVLLAEDQAMVRTALAKLLNMEPDLDVVAEVGRGDEVVAAVHRHVVDVALLDIEMPGMDGLSVAAALRAKAPDCRIIVVTTFGRPGYLRRAMEIGVHGFIVKETPVEHLSDAIRRVVAGERVIDHEHAAVALVEGANPLSNRERDVLHVAADGAPIAELASRLHLSKGTVRNYLSACIQKTSASNRAEAVRIARSKGWI